MRIFLFGIGKMTRITLQKIEKFPPNVEVLGFIDNNSDVWGNVLGGQLVYGPSILCETEYDHVIIMSDCYYQEIRDNLVYWYKIDPVKIKDRTYLLKILLMDKFKDTEDAEIREIIHYWDTHELSVFNQFVKEGEERYVVQWDIIENMPYVMFEDKRVYFPYDYAFEEYEGKKVLVDLFAEQQATSPHLYIKGDIDIEQGDVILDAGVAEGNFALQYIEKASKIYLVECDKHWIKPLQKTFEKFKEKVSFCYGLLGQFNGGEYVNIDSIVGGRLDFLKMDIEGVEIEALLGGRNVLLNNTVKCAICSYHKNGDERAIRDILERYQYKTSTSEGYMVFYHDENIYSTLDFRRGIVYARK